MRGRVGEGGPCTSVWGERMRGEGACVRVGLGWSLRASGGTAGGAGRGGRKVRGPSLRGSAPGRGGRRDGVCAAVRGAGGWQEPVVCAGG